MPTRILLPWFLFSIVEGIAWQDMVSAAGRSFADDLFLDANNKTSYDVTLVENDDDNPQSLIEPVSFSDDVQLKLLRDLFDKYDKRIRPVLNHQISINITLTMTLYQLLQVNEPEEYVILNLWMAHIWNDEYLAWDPKQYGNISRIVVPWDHLWLSDIVLYNGLDMDYSSSEKRINIELSMNPHDLTRAEVRFAFPATYRFSCKMDVYYFPRDRQNCTLVFGSWVYDVVHIDVKPYAESVKMDAFIPNQAWDVLSFNAFRHVILYSCCPHPYANVQFHLVIQRKPLFFVTNLVIPTIIVAWISFLGFFMPNSTGNERSEKVNLGITSCLAMSILLLMVSDRMPTASTYVPIMAWFFLIIIVMIACAIVLSSLVIIIQRRGRHGERVSPLCRRIFFCYISKAVFVDVPNSVLEHQTQQSSLRNARKWSKSDVVDRACNRCNGRQLAPLAKIEFDSDDEADNEIDIVDIDGNNGADTPSTVTRSSLRGVSWHVDEASAAHIDNSSTGTKHSHSEVNNDNENVRSNQKSTDVNEWELLADVVERLLLILFTFALFVVSMVMIVLTVLN